MNEKFCSLFLPKCSYVYCLCRSVLCSLIFWSQAESDITSVGNPPVSTVQSPPHRQIAQFLLLAALLMSQKPEDRTLNRYHFVWNTVTYLNYSRCSTAITQPPLSPQSSRSKMKVVLLVQLAPDCQKKWLVQFPNCTRNLLSIPQCRNFAQILHKFSTPTAFAAGMGDEQLGGMCEKSWWSPPPPASDKLSNWQLFHLTGIVAN